MENPLDQKLDLSALHLGNISLGTLLGTLLTLVICLVAVRLLTALLRRVLAQTHMDARVQKYLVRTVQLVLWVVTVLITADQLGIPVTSLVALLSVLSLAVSLAVQNVLANVAGGLVLLVTKPFAVGVRIEQRQSDCDAAQYKQYAGHPGLPASTYKLSCHLSNGRGVFSFCVCPGGQVVAAASEEGRVVTNGMSEYARDRENINGGLLVNVTPADFGSSHPLAGIAFQRRLEEAAFRLGGGGYAAPCQRVEDFLAGRPSTGPGRVIPSYRPGVRWTDLRQCLPEFVWETLALALPMLDGKVRGYAQGDAVLTAVETRSSSPVRIIRDNSGQCNVRGLYPCGEGAGYAGGILSAAADGMRCAEKIWEVYGK